MAKVCIIGSEEVAGGAPVADDIVIRSIRRVKQHFKVARNNELVVCDVHLEAYRKKRQGYERNLALYIVLAGIAFLLMALVPVFTTGFSAYLLFMGVLVAALLVLLPVITSHTPSLAAQPARNIEAKAQEMPKGRGKRK